MLKKLSLFLLAIPLLISMVYVSKEKKKPNIVFILTDDLGYNDLGFMGSNFYETPILDKLALRSTVFKRAYASCQVCSPSRGSILSGCYPTVHGITDWIGAPSGTDWRKYNRFSKLLPPEYTRQLNLNYTTIPELLKQNDYATFFAGKWHLGDTGSLPTDHGFDFNVAGTHKGSPNSFFSPYNMDNITNGPNGENLEMRLAKETASFIQNNKDKSFFAFLSFYAVHAPIQTTKKKWSYYRDKAEKMGIQEIGFEMERIFPARKKQDNPVYAGLVSSVDDAVGVVLESLSKSKLDKNTIVIFTSDNGGVVSGDNYSTNLAPLRGGKGYQWEGGIRVPLLIYHPDYKGQIVNTPVNGIDFLPTILDLVNTKIKPSQKLDGVSIFPLMKHKKIAKRPLFWHYPHYGNQGGEPSSIVQLENYKLIHYWEDERNELYNLKDDLSEKNDLASSDLKKVSELWTLLNHWLMTTHAKIPVKDPEYTIEKEELFKQKVQNVIWPNQEKARIDMLKKEYQPNMSWWGSMFELKR